MSDEELRKRLYEITAPVVDRINNSKILVGYPTIVSIFCLLGAARQLLLEAIPGEDAKETVLKESISDIMTYIGKAILNYDAMGKPMGNANERI